ncbi:MAG: glycosyltransferase [Anaerolineales bacterium]
MKIVHQNCRELVRRGHEVTVYCTNLLNKKKKIESSTFQRCIDGIRVVYLDTINFRWWPGTLGPIWLPELSSYLKREIDSFDVVHLNGYRSPIMSTTAQAAHSAGIPIVTQPHGSLPIIANTFFLKRVYDILFEKMELGNISALIALQDNERSQAIERGISPEIIDVIPNGIDPSELKELPERGLFRKRFNIEDDQQVILFLGRINKIKGVDLLIEAFASLNIPNSRLIIAGPDDGQLAEIKKSIRKHEIESQVILTGLLSGQDVKAAFHDADLFVLPSRSDAFPATIMESCLYGTPMVITDRCEISHLVKDRVAEVVPFDVQAFADAMRLLLLDRERYHRFKANCMTVVNDTFSIQVVVDRLEAVYQRVIAERINR